MAKKKEVTNKKESKDTAIKENLFDAIGASLAEKFNIDEDSLVKVYEAPKEKE